MEGAGLLTIASRADLAGDTHVLVADTRAGLNAATAERVFDSFYTTKDTGMGMGPSICRSIIRAYDGRIWGEPNAPRGAIFQFTHPVGANSIRSA